MHRTLLSLCLIVGATACDAPATAQPDEAAAYQGDRAWRRAVLEASLWQPELPYSRSLLNSYALPEGGWELLTLQTSRVAPFTAQDAARLAAGEGLTLEDATDLAPAAPPTTDAGWRALGEQVFFRLPMRADGYLDWLAAHPERWAELGVRPDADGAVRGLVRFAVPGGAVRVGMACAFCHSGDGVAGRGDRQLDLGLARALSAEARGLTAQPGLRAWGPGRVDVTDAALDTPTAIPDLWGLGEARWLNHSGVIQVVARSSLAVRFETQYILGHRMASRPDRALIWALAAFVTDVHPPRAAGPAGEGPGRAVFDRACAGCHQPDQAYSGGLVPAAGLTSDGRVAGDPERGTGRYKAPSLLGVAGNGPYLHDGSQPSLAGLLAAGHPMGAVLSATDRDALLDYLDTL